MKILFVMLHAGFVRNYESALRLLVEHGHAVHVAYELDRNKLGENVQIERLSEELPSISYGVTPARGRGVLLNLARVTRTLLDYLRYLDPRYANATALRARVEEKIPRNFQRLVGLLAGAGEWAVRLLAAALRGLETILPSDVAIERFFRDQTPDVLLVTPLVDFGSDQVDYIKTARKLRVPSALCVASWDNLTNKGLMRVIPDRVFVWNEAQKDEAVSLHETPPERIVITGAQLFDHWFDWRPSRSRADFCRQVGLDADQPFILYVGSSLFIAPDEAPFVEKWIRQLRAGEEPALARAGVLVRPYPTNIERWLAVDFARFGNVAVWPKLGADPFGEQFKMDFYDSMYYSAAVVGVNTSALIEAGIVGRPVCTLLAPEFAHSQEGTLHFHHLLHVNGGLLHVARNMDEHMAQLRTALAESAGGEEKSRRFVEAFVRPQGLDKACTPILASAVEQMATLAVTASPVPGWAWLLRVGLYPVARVVALLWQPGRRLRRQHFRETPVVVPVRKGVLAVRTALRETWCIVSRYKRRGTRSARKSLRAAQRRIGLREIPRRLTKLRRRSSKAGRHAVKRAKRVAVKTASYLGRRPSAMN